MAINGTRLSPGTVYLGRAVVILIYLFLLGPLMIIVLTSFNPSRVASIACDRPSIQWYVAFWHDESFMAAFRFSIYLGIFAAVSATVIGFMSAYALRLLPQHIGRSLRVFVMLPSIIPYIITSLALLLLLSVSSLPSAAVLWLGHVILCLPFAVMGITASMNGLSLDAEKAAMTLGASQLRVIWEIVLPAITPGIVSSLLFSFVVSFGDVYIAMFLAGPGVTTLPVEIFSYMQWESTPMIAAITSVQMLLIVAFGLIVDRLVGLQKILGV